MFSSCKGKPKRLLPRCSHYFDGHEAGEKLSVWLQSLVPGEFRLRCSHGKPHCSCVEVLDFKLFGSATFYHSSDKEQVWTFVAKQLRK